MNITIDSSSSFGKKSIITPIWKQITKQKEQEGLVQTLTFKQTANLDHTIAMKFKPVKEEFFRRTNAVWRYLKNIVND